MTVLPSGDPSATKVVTKVATKAAQTATNARPVPPLSRGWALVIFAGITLTMGGMFARVAQLQTDPPEQLMAQVSERTSTMTEPGRRGDVLDRRGRLLAATRFGYRVVVDPAEFPTKNIEQHLLNLSKALGQEMTVVGPRIVQALAENERRTKAFAAKQEIQLNLTPEELDEDAEKAAALLESQGTQADGTPPARLASTKPASKPRLIRYLVMSDVLDDGELEAMKKLKIAGVHLESRPVREMASPEIAAVMTGKVDFNGKGMLAAERMLDEKLQAKDGSFKFVRDARGQPLWIEPGAYTPSQRGQDVRISIDLELQRLLRDELARGVEEADAQGGRAILVDSHTGEILAMADSIRRPSDVVEYDWVTVIPKDKRLDGPRYVTVRDDPKRALHPALAHNRVVEDLYEPGSTFKPFMWAASTELGLASPDEVFNTHWGQWQTPYGRPIKDVVKRASMTWREVLINSSNVGMVQGTARMTFEQMRSFVVAFGFGKRTNIGVPGESVGMVTSQKAWSKYTQTSVAFGHEVAITPLQMARAFCVFARAGEYSGTLPNLRLTSPVGSDNSTPETDPGQRVLSVKTAQVARDTLRGVTHNLDRKLAEGENHEGGWRYELFGKSGTADIPMTNPPEGKRKPKGSDGYFRGQYNASFVAGGPYENPRLVCVVVIDDPGRELIAKKHHYGTYVAGPVVRRIMDKALAYLGTPASPKAEGDGPAHAD